MIIFLLLASFIFKALIVNVGLIMGTAVPVLSTIFPLLGAIAIFVK